MKRLKKLFVSLLTGCMIFGFAAVETSAAAYTYTVNLYAGNKGTVNGSDKVSIAGFSAGQSVDFSAVNMAASDPKYYVKGIRRSGEDVIMKENKFVVDGDADYVVAYGISANRIAYTITYQDQDGNELLPSETFYGDIGDKPVVAYRYIEDYIPQALAMTRTLSANAAENVFPFVYTPGESDTIITNTTVVTVPGDTVTTTVTVPGTTTGTGTDDGTAATATDNPAAAAAADANTAAADAATDNPAGTDETTDETEEIPDETVPEGLVDLDDEEVPAGNINAEPEAVKKSLPIVAGVGIGVGALAALAALTVFIIKKRKIK